MAITYYRVLVDRIQIPNGSVARRNDIVSFDSSLVGTLVTSGLLEVTTNFSAIDPPRLDTTVFTGQTKGEIFRPKAAEDYYDMVAPEALKTHIPSKLLTDIVETE